MFKDDEAAARAGMSELSFDPEAPGSGVLKKAMELDSGQLLDAKGNVIQSKASMPPLRLPLTLVRQGDE